MTARPAVKIATRLKSKRGATGVDRMRALGRLKAGEMNGTEKAYEASALRPAMIAGDILWYKFEAMKFRLGSNCFYTPDFVVMRADGQLEAHEVKGFWTDDARVKIKVAADQYPMQFIAVQKVPSKAGGGWKSERF